MPSHTDQKVYSSEVNGSQEQTFILTDGADCPGGMDWGEGKTLMAWNMRTFCWKEAFFSQEITLHMEMLQLILVLSCTGENPV